MASSSGAPKTCDCGFDEDGLEFCTNGIIYSDVFRRIVETPCNCICHGNVIALKPVTPINLLCPECRANNYHKMDCSRRRVAERELVAA